MTAGHLRFPLVFLLISFLLAACGGYPTHIIKAPAPKAEIIVTPPSVPPKVKAPPPTARQLQPSNLSSPGKLKGWQKPYTVFGKRYEPLLTHHGFVEEGIASWYGRDFHGKKTSNGEIYDMYAMTAAHKTLPLGVHVKVRNRANGRETIVRINDRGPFVKGRIIDLSYTAAKELGVVGPGTAPVHIEALGYKVTDASGVVSYEAPESYDVGNYSIQVGAFTVPANARRLAAQLKGQYGFATVQEGWINGRLFHRVRVGRYDSLTAAEAAKVRFEQGGYPSSFVVAMESVEVGQGIR